MILNNDKTMTSFVYGDGGGLIVYQDQIVGLLVILIIMLLGSEILKMINTSVSQ